MKLSNTTIYSSTSGLYIANGDHNLIEVVGDDVAVVEQVLSGLAAADSLDSIYDRLRPALDDDRDYFDEIVAWLVAQGIALPGATPAEAKPVATYLHAPYLTAEARQHVLTQLSQAGTQRFTSADDYRAAELVIVLAPLFEYQQEVQALNDYTYRRQIPVCHVGVDTGAFTLGPLVHAAQGTPCLSCYMQRKLANLKSPKQTVAFIRHPNKSRLAQADPRLNPYFDVALTHLAVELNRFYERNQLLSPLLARSVVFDHFDYSVTKSKVLRVPACPVCSSAASYSALNP